MAQRSGIKPRSRLPATAMPPTLPCLPLHLRPARSHALACTAGPAVRWAGLPAAVPHVSRLPPPGVGRPLCVPGGACQGRAPGCGGCRRRLGRRWRRWPACGPLPLPGPRPNRARPRTQTDDVGPLLDALLSAMSGDALLRRLELDPDSRCILSGGQLVQTAALASPAGRAQLAQHAAAGLLSVQESASADLLQPQDALERAVRQPRLAARRVVVTSAAGESGPA